MRVIDLDAMRNRLDALPDDYVLRVSTWTAVRGHPPEVAKLTGGQKVLFILMLAEIFQAGGELSATDDELAEIGNMSNRSARRAAQLFVERDLVSARLAKNRSEPTHYRLTASTMAALRA